MEHMLVAAICLLTGITAAAAIHRPARLLVRVKDAACRHRRRR